jgi:hypothetical protein
VTGATKNAPMTRLRRNITTGKTSSFLRKNITATEHFNNFQLLKTLSMNIPPPLASRALKHLKRIEHHFTPFPPALRLRSACGSK